MYSISDLESKGKPDMWEGCRNYTVRNFLRDSMSIGDLALFHHSNSVPSGIAGVLRIAGKAYADPTQFDPTSEYYDAKSPKENPRWLAIDVEFVKKYPKVLSLADLRTHPQLSEMWVLRRGQRLSIMPVTFEEFELVEAMASA